MIEKVYKILLKTFGKQGWWPLSKGWLETRHHRGKPRNDSDRFEITIGAILTQNCHFGY